MKFIKKEKELLELCIAELGTRREVWATSAKPLIQAVFRKAAEEASSVGYPFRLSSRIHDEDKNEETVQLSSSVNRTGVVVEENRKSNGENYKIKKHIAEKGCSLVASLGIDGAVSFMLFPYSSDRHAWREDCIIINSLVDPVNISEKFLEDVISHFLFYARFSSIKGTRLRRLDVDMARYYYLLFLDIRNQGKVTRTALSVAYDWLKILAAGAIGYFVAIAVQ